MMKTFRFAPKLRSVTAAVGSIFGKTKKDGEDVVGYDLEGEALFKEDIIAEILEKLDERKKEKLPFEQQWMLNSNFLAGNQYCEINTYKGEVEQTQPISEWMQRESYNQIAPLIETRIANLKKINHMMRVKPATNDFDDYAKAEVSTSILQYTQKTSDFESKKNTMIHWNEVCGNCFWLSWWDKDKGEKYAVEKEVAVNENGEENIREKAYYQGDIDYGLITPYEIFPESVFNQGIEGQRSIILEQIKSVDEIYDLYGIKVQGSEVETFSLTPIPMSAGLGYEKTVMGLGHRTAKDSERVITYFERPSKHKPNGRMVIIVGEEHLVYYGDLPYKNIPIIQVVCHEVAGQFFGKSTIESLIPLQRKYNECINKIHEFVSGVGTGGYFVEEGSLVDLDYFVEEGFAPGTVAVIKTGYSKPTPMDHGSLPGEVIQERYNLRNDMEYVAGVSQLMVTGNTPSGVTSGTAISNLMEIDNTRLSLTGDHIRNSIRRLAILWLEIYKKFATTWRIVNYVGSNDIAKALVWINEDINSYDVEYVTENELLMSEDMQKQRFFELFNMGLFTDDDGRIPMRVKLRAMEYLKAGNYGDMMNLSLLQMQAAQRENVFFEDGVVPEISEFDEHEIHIEEHKRYILQMKFQVLKHKKPEYAAALERHIKEHEQIVDKKEKEKMFLAMQGQMM